MKKIDIFNHIWPKPFFDALISLPWNLGKYTANRPEVPAKGSYRHRPRPSAAVADRSHHPPDHPCRGRPVAAVADRGHPGQTLPRSPTAATATPFPSAQPLLPPTQPPPLQTTRLIKIDPPLMRPIIPQRNQTGAHGITPHIGPFFGIRFGTPQHMVEEPGLPHRGFKR